MRRLKLYTAFVILAAALISLISLSRESIASVEKEKRHFIFSYQLSISNIPNDAKTMEIWIPFPQNNKDQTVENYQITTALPHRFYIDPEYGNKVIDVNLTEKIPDDLTVSLSYDIIRFENSSLPANKPTFDIHPIDLKRCLDPDKLVPIDGKIAREAQQVINDKMTPLEKAKAIYDHLNLTMKYDKTGEGWGYGDAIYACDFRKGNCTDIHSLFIGMLRSIGIPARFHIGFPLPEDKTDGKIAGYHCWADFYIDDIGWIPVDISEAIKHPEKKNYFFGHLDPNRISFTTGRDIKIQTSTGQESLNYFIYPFVQVDGVHFDNVNYSFSFSQH